MAEHLFEAHAIELVDDLKEIDCGEWELKVWDEIPKHAINPWMDDLLNEKIPGGESYTDVFERVNRFFNGILRQQFEYKYNIATVPRIAIVAHGGVIRSILSAITNRLYWTPLKLFHSIMVA